MYLSITENKEERLYKFNAKAPVYCLFFAAGQYPRGAMICPLIRANRFPTLSKRQNICGLIASPPFASTCISVDFKRTQGESTCDRPRGGENAYTAPIMDKLDFTFIHAPATYDFPVFRI